MAKYLGRVFGNEKAKLIREAEEIAQTVAKNEQDNRSYISISLEPKQRIDGLFRIQANVFSHENHLIFKDVSV